MKYNIQCIEQLTACLNDACSYIEVSCIIIVCLQLYCGIECSSLRMRLRYIKTDMCDRLETHSFQQTFSFSHILLVIIHYQRVSAAGKAGIACGGVCPPVCLSSKTQKIPARN